MTITMAPGSGSRSAPLSCWMLLAVLAASWQFTAQASRSLIAFRQSISASSDSERPQVIRADLLHRDHPDSPLAPAEGTTLAHRWAAAVKRSDNLISSRGRRLADFQTPVARKGDFSGEYVMSISFGTPPQKFIGLVDTGSDLVWVQCIPCPGCFNFTQRSPFYNPANSSSETYLTCSDPRCSDFTTAPCSVAKTCRIEYGYADGSQIQGTLTTERITLSNTGGTNPNASDFVMGCMNNNTGNFDNYDGIVGFGRGTYSLPSQLSTIAYLPVISYCLVPFHATTTNTSSMLFGVSDPTNELGLVYTPLLPIGTTNYYVNMTGISVNGVALDIPASLFEYDSAADTGGVIFDSGNAITRFLPEVYAPFRDAVASLIKYLHVADPDSYCFNISGVTTPVYPSVTFHFGGVDGSSVVDFDLGPENAFGPYTDEAGVSCLAFRSVAGDDMSIGNLQQANHYIETDVVNKRMGWISKDCTA